MDALAPYRPPTWPTDRPSKHWAAPSCLAAPPGDGRCKAATLGPSAASPIGGVSCNTRDTPGPSGGAADRRFPTSEGWAAPRAPGTLHPGLFEGVHIMARVATTTRRARPDGAIIELALLPQGATDDAWSIDQEPMGTGWHDSSWMLKKGLEVTEGLSLEAIPPEWQWHWWCAAGAGLVG
jgi:hypothetical protein